ncbi:MAG: 2-iminoacetate synthase ThiH [Tissierellia bacterium]|nr:2-iminoacetate synthase ThiH [Tissierellia bacterium]
MIDINTNPMEYQPGMEIIDHDLMDKVLETIYNTDFDKFTDEDVLSALEKQHIDERDFAALLSPAAAGHLEEIAIAASRARQRHFGNTVTLFTPLYIANHCENYCVYCGFNVHNKIKRAKLDEAGIIRELDAIARTGLQEVLILTGESRSASDVEYIARACALAAERFRLVGVEIYPINSDEYAVLRAAGCDYVTVFQETYQPDIYGDLHLGGFKRIFPYRFNAQERALMGGMRGVGFAALLGLADWRRDALATGLHATLIQKKYPHAEIAFSCPRLRPINGQSDYPHKGISEHQLLQIICAYRLLAPYASITISSRERSEFRDNIIRIAATKTSAGVSTGIGEHDGEQEGDAQFDIADARSVEEMLEAIRLQGMQPSMVEYINV